MTIQVQEDLGSIRQTEGGPPTNSVEVLNLWKRHPWHFANFVWGQIDKKKLRNVLYTNEDGDEYTEDAQALISLYIKSYYNLRAELKTLDKLQFDAAYRRYRNSREDVVRREAAEFDAAQFYSFPEADADMSYWGRLPAWTAGEAAALAFGKNPDVVTQESVKAVAKDRASRFAHEFSDLKRLIQRAVISGQLSDPMTPQAFFVWVDKIGLALTGDLKIQAGLGASEEQPLDTSSSEINAQAVHKLYTIVLGMAISKYDFDPDPYKDVGSEKIRILLNDLHNTGINIDVKTLKKYIDRAYSFARGKNVFSAARGKRAK